MPGGSTTPRSRRCTTSGAASGRMPWPCRALGVTVQGVDVDPVTAAIADINLRPWPDSRARVGLAEEFEAPRDPLRSRVGVWLDPARRVPGHDRPRTDGSSGSSGSTRSGPRGSSCSRSRPRCPPPGPSSRPRCRTTPSRSAPRRSGPRSPARCSSAPCGGGRWPSDRGAAPASSGPSRSPIEVDETMAEPDDPDRRVAGRRRAVALRARPRGDPGGAAGGRHRRDARQRGRHRARLRRQRGAASTCRSPGATPCARRCRSA